MITRPLSLLAVVGLVLTVAAPAASAQSYTPISGSGSTWSSNAIDQWRTNVAQYGMRISFTGSGSSTGRNQFKAGQVDFAVSEIPYGLTDGGVRDVPPAEGTYAYMPIVAGGTSLMYNLKIGGKRVTNLRLSGEVVTKIFTGVITTWADPAIARDNPGLKLPDRKVVPVVRSDGSGSTAQFTSWMASQHPGLWDDFCRRAKRATPCGFTSNYPKIPPMVGQDLSIGVANYVRQEGTEGSITYVEYSYARAAAFPVVKLLNAKGYYVEPKSSAVAVALLAAKVNETDLTQDLSQVYGNQDARSYPMASYSYMVLPTKETAKFTKDKGRTLSDFAYYFLCEGQQQADLLGYSPLPINLVRAGMDQVAKIPGTTRQNKDISKCNNPTFSADGTNTLAVTAPQPKDCDKQGPIQCEDGTGGAKEATRTGGGEAAAAEQEEAAVVEEQAAAGEEAAVVEDVAAGESTAKVARRAREEAYATPVSVDLREDNTALLVAVAGVLLVALVVGPPLVARRLRGRGEGR
ncbi:phosphate transport system substrate-binding protein [Saccharothrix ecbatanensis]|jgi:phosphate transport system substrate-binding protein|uniref:Phosphate transport system substrate-binding protein n=1 Tax=Saccharothrix ecbatanensis TaxID=1105145 RepID=A0A7W9M356_9PSEU|nr:phosphate ABC transporter substrate-binding protein PstS [Saccharothrix ecbatanensis]MBB5805662.1 phosphate transport system substrate-binding protein [Saccharothrix ecbatanensis]